MNNIKIREPLIITPQPLGMLKQAQSLWQARRLIYWLSRRDLILRYRQTFMGVLWALLYPAGLFGVYLFSLGYLAKMPLPNGVPYSIYILTGLVPWLYFQTTLVTTSSALQQNFQLISKVYFPRLALIIVAFITASFDFLWMILVLFCVAFFYGFLTLQGMGMVLFWSFLAGILGMGLGIVVSTLTVYYRDINIALPVILQIGFFLSPVVYATHLVPEKYLNWYYYNPITAIIESERKGFGLDNIVNPHHQTIAIAVTVIILIFSLYIFRKLERDLVDRM